MLGFPTKMGSSSQSVSSARDYPTPTSNFDSPLYEIPQGPSYPAPVPGYSPFSGQSSAPVQYPYSGFPINTSPPGSYPVLGFGLPLSGPTMGKRPFLAEEEDDDGGTPPAKQPRVEDPEVYRTSVLKKLSASTRTTQACDRCRVSHPHELSADRTRTLI